jgi:subtilisin
VDKGIWITPEQARDDLGHGSGRGVKIAVLDSGIERSHPALATASLADDLAILDDGVSLKTAPGEGFDVFGHGTAVAGIIHRIAPEAEIGSIRVLGENLRSRTAIIREGARVAIERRYHILNCSFGCGVPEHVLHYKSWIDEAYVRNIHVVAACNNLDSTRPEWPGHFSSVITVNMALVPQQKEEDCALFYQAGQLVEFIAPGIELSVPWKDGQMKKVTGSSFAAAQVSGLIARMLSVHPGLMPSQLKALLQRAAQPWNAGV